MFGVELENVYALGGGNSVPVVVIQGVDYLMGLGEEKLEGLFRVPGNKQKIMQLKSAYVTPKTKVFLSFLSFIISIRT